jgi:hypothetical protein
MIDIDQPEKYYVCHARWHAMSLGLPVPGNPFFGWVLAIGSPVVYQSSNSLTRAVGAMSLQGSRINPWT